MPKFRIYDVEPLKIGIEMLSTSDGQKFRLSRNLSKRFTTEALELGYIDGDWIYFDSEKEASIMIYESGLRTGNGYLRERAMKHIKYFYSRYISNQGVGLEFQKIS